LLRGETADKLRSTVEGTTWIDLDDAAESDGGQPTARPGSRTR
jgi:hypothetical protein